MLLEYLVVKDLRKMGVHGKVILKSDQENAVLDVLQAVCKCPYHHLFGIIFFLFLILPE